jgi:hypothetical protein
VIENNSVMAAIKVLFIIDWFIFGYKDKYFLGLSYTISCFLAYYFTIEWYSGKDNVITVMTDDSLFGEGCTMKEILKSYIITIYIIYILYI